MMMMMMMMVMLMMMMVMMLTMVGIIRLTTYTNQIANHQIANHHTNQTRLEPKWLHVIIIMMVIILYMA